ncbi:hypothetical protein BOTU111921_15675 [Bordetella tumbae]|uniref:hypothetical protein n=1 Tax=Bordetella tumbae TaxID=1649139 RepID=UPI0039F13A94
MRTLAILFIAATTLAGCIVVPHHGGHGHYRGGHGYYSQPGPSPYYYSGPRYYRY